MRYSGSRRTWASHSAASQFTRSIAVYRSKFSLHVCYGSQAEAGVVQASKIGVERVDAAGLFVRQRVEHIFQRLWLVHEVALRVAHAQIAYLA